MTATVEERKSEATAGGVGRVVESRDPRFAEGAWVSSFPGIQEYAVLKGDESGELALVAQRPSGDESPTAAAS